MKKGSHHSEENIKKMREAQLGTHPAPETIEKISGEKNHNFGKHPSPEAREKMHQAHLGEKNHNFGNCPSPETLEKMRQAHFGKQHTPVTIEKFRQAKRGEKHPNWQGGISFEEYSTAWTEQLKEAIRKRDKYSCQLCGRKQEELSENFHKKLVVHHIDYDKKNLDPKNLISLCRSCHGKTNYKRETWICLFSENFRNIICDWFLE